MTAINRSRLGSDLLGYPERVDTPVKDTTDRLEYLDSLRGIGAVIVAVSHFYQIFPGTTWPIASGFAAVGFFFAHSGYVLTRKVMRDPDISMTKFAIARFFRMWPPFVVAVLISWWGVWFCPHYSTMDYAFQLRFRLPRTEDLISQLNPLNFYAPNLVAPSWTLHPEMVMSLVLIPLLLIGRKSWAWMGIILFAAVLVGAITPLLIAFMAGAVLYLVEDHIKMTNVLKILILIGCGLAYFVPEKAWPGNVYIWWGFLSVGIIAVTLSSPSIQCLLNNPCLVFLGKRSFGIYLLHWALMGTLGSWLFHIGCSWSVVLLAILAASVFAADVFWRLIESPSIRAGKLLASYWK